MYKIRVTERGDTVIVRNNTEWIPSDPANTDYQQYLRWVAEGNMAEEWDPEA